jgi:hypothetical protein
MLALLIHHGYVNVLLLAEIIDNERFYKHHIMLLPAAHHLEEV